MTSASERTTGEADGFEGEVSGLGLADILQLNTQNRFSGCVDVRHEGKRGLIFSRDGEIVHAEHGGLVGEEAFYAILAWPGGRFVVQPNVVTTLCSIRKSGPHLILEAHRVMDEERSRRPPPVPAASAKPAPAASLVETLRQIPGVLYAVVLRKDGAHGADPSYEADVLAGQALYLAMSGGNAGASLRLGELASAAIHGTTRHLLLFAAKNQFLSVLVNADAQLGRVEAAVRKVLAAGR